MSGTVSAGPGAGTMVPDTFFPRSDDHFDETLESGGIRWNPVESGRETGTQLVS